MISCLKNSVFIYIVDSYLCQREHDPYISSNSSTLEYPSLLYCDYSLGIVLRVEAIEVSSQWPQSRADKATASGVSRQRL